jgi:hypothetical protein
MNCDSSVIVAEFYDFENNQARSNCASDLRIFGRGDRIKLASRRASLKALTLVVVVV